MQREQGKSTTYDLYDSPDLLYTYWDRLGQCIDSLGRIGGAHTSNSTQSSKKHVFVEVTASPRKIKMLKSLFLSMHSLISMVQEQGTGQRNSQIKLFTILYNA